MNCRFCNNELTQVFADLGFAPLSNAFLNKDELSLPEKYFPLKVNVCNNCFLVQTSEEKKSEEIFNEDYVYYSSFSQSWLRHAEEYVLMMIKRFGFNKNSFVVEVASNDGYLLQYFKRSNVLVLGIEPSKGTADVALNKGIETRIEYFGKKTAEKLILQDKKPDLIIGNNVLAHVPDINDFAAGFKLLLADDGVITLEFPHLLRLIQQKQFDTIYHEHFFYYSLSAVKRIFDKYQLEIFDVEQISTHGGSLRLFIKHNLCGKHKISGRVNVLLEEEDKLGMNSIDFYKSFQTEIEKFKINFLDFLLAQKQLNKKVIGYGAAAKGNTLLNYCGVKNDLIDYLVDASPYKQNKYLPGSHIPVFGESIIKETKPDYIIIFPWNIKEEIMEQLSYTEDWGAQFVIPIPRLEII